MEDEKKRLKELADALLERLLWEVVNNPQMFLLFFIAGKMLDSSKDLFDLLMDMEEELIKLLDEIGEWKIEMLERKMGGKKHLQHV